MAVIPTIGEAPQLPTLVGRLLGEGVSKVLLIANAEPPWGPHLPRSGKDVVVLQHGGTIYDSWNLGLDIAQADGSPALVLNDDAELAPGAAGKVLGTFDADDRLAVVGFDPYCRPEPARVAPYQMVSGSYRHGGVPGFAFAARPELCARVDPQFEWWYGDDDLFFATEAAGGRLAVRLGACVGHQAETTAVNHPWTLEARARDAERFRGKWGDR